MSLKKGMLRKNKWKYIIYFQNNEFNELISKEIIQMIQTNTTSQNISSIGLLKRLPNK